MERSCHDSVRIDGEKIIRTRSRSAPCDDAAAKGVHRIAWFDSGRPLRSGWAWGQQYLNGNVAAAEADVGRGRLYLFGPEIAFRGQPHGTFKLLFDSIYSAAERR